MPFISVLDFGAHQVIALIAQKKKRGGWDILGGANVQARGVQQGEILHLGDAVETVLEALRNAERAAGEKIKSLYYNFSHTSLEGVQACGTRLLIGEGQIGLKDIREAKDAALRTVGSFEKNPVYAKESGFLIDEKDRVRDAMGIYGQRLDVFIYAMTADAGVLDQWKRLMRRCYVPKATPVLSAWSTAWAVLAMEERMKKNIVLDLGDDLMSAVLFEGNAVQDHLFLQPDSRERMIGDWLKKHANVSQIVVTGDRAKSEMSMSYWAELNAMPARIGSAHGVSQLTEPSHASAVGLLEVAQEMERNKSTFFEGTSAFSSIKEKATAAWNEYF